MRYRRYMYCRQKLCSEIEKTSGIKLPGSIEHETIFRQHFKAIIILRVPRLVVCMNPKLKSILLSQV